MPTIGDVLAFKANAHKIVPPREGPRSISTLAWEVQRTWKNVNYAAKPYLVAMFTMTSIDDPVGHDSGRSVVSYFLANASAFRGPDARRIKVELKAMLK
jgi:hypothetical protein